MKIKYLMVVIRYKHRADTQTKNSVQKINYDK